ncbi:MAG: 1,4-dihydroxy-2-naphthoate octaprenyltransferase [Planctomycetes bacterium]|nr:1,4-dihydroxy-2-naphthoate octaprenyltransferase [Planctomycetota bacterium]
MKSKAKILFLASRPKFLLASVSPILVGSALGFAAVGTFNFILFILALFAIMLLHAGANIANDYFDHTSGNDWANKNVTPFSGGTRLIQDGILSPKATLLTSIVALAFGSVVGLVIVVMTKSVFILILGLIGLLGGFFYTAPPVRLGYRGIGEFVIAILFGLLPVYGSYYLQTGAIDTTPILPAAIVSLLIFLVILINEFPDLNADAAVNKKTLIVWLGINPSIWIYRIVFVATFIIAAVMLTRTLMFFAALLYLFTLPIAVAAVKFANKKNLTTPGKYQANQTTILWHSIASITLTLGFIISAIRIFAA